MVDFKRASFADKIKRDVFLKLKSIPQIRRALKETDEKSNGNFEHEIVAIIYKILKDYKPKELVKEGVNDDKQFI